jgi:hypothetical protein
MVIELGLLSFTDLRRWIPGPDLIVWNGLSQNRACFIEMINAEK